MIDLHGLEVRSALELLEELLELHRTNFQAHDGAKNRRVLRIITGIGIHSPQGRAKLRPAVKRYLADRGYRVVEANPGMFQVILPN